MFGPFKTRNYKSVCIKEEAEWGRENGIWIEPIIDKLTGRLSTSEPINWLVIWELFDINGVLSSNDNHFGFGFWLFIRSWDHFSK